MTTPGTKTTFLKRFDPEELQRNVWYWRRRRAQHLDEHTAIAPDASQPFSAESVAKADRAFVLMYRRAPQPHEWTTLYLLLLRQLERDPQAFDSVLRAEAAEALDARVTPCSVPLRRIERPRHSSYTIPAMLIGVTVLGIFAIAVVSFDENTHVEMVVGILIAAFLGVAISVPIISNATDVFYACPECGYHYAGAFVTRCVRCHLEFPRADTPWQPIIALEHGRFLGGAGAGDRT